MVAEFIQTLCIIGTCLSVCRHQCEEHLTCIDVVSDDVSDYIAVNVCECFLIKLECNVLNRTLAQDLGEGLNVDILAVLNVVIKIIVVDLVSVLAVLLNDVKGLISKLKKRIVIVAVSR